MNGKPTYEELIARVRELERMQSYAKRIEVPLKKNMLDGRSVIDKVADTFWVIAIKSMRFTFFSASIERSVGYTGEEMTDQRVEDVMPPGSYLRLMEALNRELKRGKAGHKNPQPVSEVELEFYHMDGHSVWVGTSISFIYNEKGLLYEMVGVLRDVTQRVKRQQQLTENERNYRLAFENSATASMVVEEDTSISLVNQEFVRLLGHSKAETQGQLRLAEIVTAEESPRIVQYHCLRRSGTPLVPRTYETECVDHAGTAIPVLISEALIPKTKKSVASVLNISDQKRMQDAFYTQRTLFRELFEKSPQAVVLLDADGIIVEVNLEFEELFGFKIEKIIGQSAHMILVPQDLMEEDKTIHQSAINGRVVRKETVRKHQSGRLIPVSILAYPIKVREQLEGVFCIYQDISERKAFEEQLQHRAFHDLLTNIPNRALFMERLSRAMERAKRRKDYSFAVMLIDLDRFKSINDRFGQLEGDKLLVVISKRIQACLRTVDTVARLGADEFAILIEEFANQDDVLDIVDRVDRAIRKPFAIDGHHVAITNTIGLVLDTQVYQSPEEILRDIDIALYHAKEKGPGQHAIFDKQMLEKAVEALKTEYELQQAIETDQLLLFYQPIVAADSQKLKGFEALIRWDHPVRGVVSPQQFIGIAEETGLIVQIGEWTIREACRQISEWQDKIGGDADFSVNVNISAKHFMQKDLVLFIQQALDEFQLAPHYLKIELTESVLMEDSQMVVQKLGLIRELGIQLVIDDFGTGYSSLSYLQQLPIDILKIDRSFIMALGKEHESGAIVKTVVNLAKHLGLQVVAEGVEEQLQLDQLQTLECDTVQGYFISRPLDKHATFEWIQQNSLKHP
jgi:Amt family ammonium transporter